MAHVQKLPDHALDTIAKQVGKLYPSLDNNVTQVQPLAALTETFPIWTLSIDAIDTGKDNLLELVQDTHRWHSQILIDGKPEAVARSIVLDGDVSGWSVKQVLKGDLAKTVDDAIRWIDAEVETDSLVRILEVPAFFITALWLIDGQESSIVIAKSPESLQSLNPLVQYSSQEFLEILRRESPAVGIRDERPQRQDRPGPKSPQRNTFNVLSIDTGIDGITPAMVLAAIEHKTGLSTIDNFDLISGTSAGGILALGLSARSSNGRPQYTASDLVDTYKNWWNDFFKSSFCFSQTALESLILSIEEVLARAEEFPNGPENVLGTFFHNATLGDVLNKTRTMVTYYDSAADTPFFLKSWDPEHATVEMRYAAWATSAAFTCFKPFRLPIGSETRILVDGTVFVNSPILAYEEAKKIIAEEEDFKNYQESDVFIFSLQSERELDASQKCNSLGDKHICLRIPPNQTDDNMDNTSENNITQREGPVDKLIESVEFDRVCDQLMAV